MKLCSIIDYSDGKLIKFWGWSYENANFTWLLALAEVCALLRAFWLAHYFYYYLFIYATNAVHYTHAKYNDKKES